jgi:hypothetical protein
MLGFDLEFGEEPFPLLLLLTFVPFPVLLWPVCVVEDNDVGEDDIFCMLRIECIAG